MTLLPEIEDALLDAVRRDQAHRHGVLGTVRGWMLRRPRALLALAGAVLVGGTAAAAVSLSVERSGPLSGSVPPGQPRPALRAEPGSAYRIALVPLIDVGSVGWCDFISFARRAAAPIVGSHGGCGYTPAALGVPIFAHDEVGGPGLHFVFTSPAVAAVRIDNRLTVLTRTDPQLPSGFRFAVFDVPRGMRYSNEPPGGGVTAIDARGRVIPVGGGGPPVQPRRRWTYPGAEPKGVCSIQLRLSAMFRPIGGTVLTSIVGDPGIIGHAFLPCANLAIDADGVLLSGAVLLDARNPGSPPGAIPGMRPVPGHPGYVDRPDTIGSRSPDTIGPAGPERLRLRHHNLLFPPPGGGLTARRVRNAWVVVEGGDSIQQRVAALRNLVVGPLRLSPLRTPIPPPTGARIWIRYRPLPGLQEASATALDRHTVGASFYYGDWGISATASTPGPAAVFRSKRPVAGRPGEFLVSVSLGTTSLVRHTGNVWIEVDGGSGVRQEQSLLDDLSISRSGR